MESRVVVAEDQVSSEIGGEVAILDLKAGTYYGLDNVGARVWDLIREPKKVSEVRDVLLGEYNVNPERCERDLLLLIQDLTNEGLVKVNNETAA